MALRLFCDRKSHPSRAAIFLLQATKIPHEEVSLNLFRGQHWKEPALPFKKLPVITHGPLTVAESTSILRYIGQLPGGEPWYGGLGLKDKIKVDEFLDFWQSSLNPAALALVQNVLMFKMFFRLKEPNAKAVADASALHSKHKLLLDSYFLEKGAKPFIGGDRASIADLLCAATLDQTKEAGADHAANTDYMERVREAVSAEIYDQVTSDCRAIPSILREMKMLPAATQ